MTLSVFSRVPQNAKTWPLFHPGSVKQSSGFQPSVYALMHEPHVWESCGVSPLAISAAQVSHTAPLGRRGVGQERD